MRMRLADWRSVGRLIGECRELGHDRTVWREHLLCEMSRLIDTEIGMIGEMMGCRALKPVSMGVVTWGWQTGFVGRNVFDVQMEVFDHDPYYSPTLIEGLPVLEKEPMACFGRSEIQEDRPWYASLEYQLILRSYGTDHTLWCFQPISCSAPDQNVGLVFSRAFGRRDFDGREHAMAREVVKALTSLAGGSLARFSEPAASDLPPRARAVLRCLLEGDSDKQIAARLGLSPHTVNQYIKMIYRHFVVRSRPELMARWIRRGWGVRNIEGRPS